MIFKTGKCLLFFLIWIVGVCGEESLDIEKLPSFRTKQYSGAPYKKIVVFSAPRTGSSLVYNVLKFLFEDERSLSRTHDEFNQECIVHKIHKMNELELLREENALFVVTVRDPIQAVASNYRISPRKIKNIRLFVEEKLHMYRDYVLFTEQMGEKGRQVVYIKFEDFEVNFGYLFDFIERQFSIAISEEDRQLIQKGYAKENVYSAIQGFPDFRECLPISGFHGKHVTLEPYTPPPELLFWLNRYLEDVKPTFSRFGYFLE